MWAVGEGEPGVVEILLEAGAGIDVADEEGITPLMEAVTVRSENLVRFLLAHGADVTLKDALGHNALWMAQKKKNRQIVDMLESAEEVAVTKATPQP
jgi:ankyrin repeat protein